jgi:hypothetical protein
MCEGNYTRLMSVPAAQRERLFNLRDQVVLRVLDTDENLAVGDLWVVERRGAPRDSRRDQ